MPYRRAASYLVTIGKSKCCQSLGWRVGIGMPFA
jgi:hypothetical protein